LGSEYLGQEISKKIKKGIKHFPNRVFTLKVLRLCGMVNMVWLVLVLLLRLKQNNIMILYSIIQSMVTKLKQRITDKRKYNWGIKGKRQPNGCLNKLF
jgi:hypothetical protein